MTRRRRLWLGLAITLAAAAAVIGAGVQALAAPGAATHANYHGPHRSALTRAAARGTNHSTNYQGPARPVTRQDSKNVRGQNQP
ncbi:MAG TPA: hypothetical protein VMA95_12570 [Streptosporangiaceae bacterium]|nr:hypothetical protein [Streptosporangiaceae bacterium]